MDIGNRLRGLREAKGLSHADIERRSGLSIDLLSEIDDGRGRPPIPVLKRWAKALDVSMLQLFAFALAPPEAPVPPERIPVGSQERTLLGLFGQMPGEDRALLKSLARDLVKRKGKRG
jgi:transcriptional regulator with XRE-family HTH domain